MGELKQWRAANGWSQTQAAELLGVSESVYAAWEQGRRKPAHPSLLWLATRYVTFMKNSPGRPRKRRAVSGPEGVFPSLSAAAAHCGVTRQAIGERLKYARGGWRYVTPP